VLDYHKLPLPLNAQILLFIAFLMAFAVKVPMWPVHTWLPDAHVEAPTGGSAVLAAVLLKLGGYGFIRLSLPILPPPRPPPPALPAQPPRREPLPRRIHDHAVARRDRLHRAGRARADRHEEADRVFVDLAHGLRDAGVLHLQRLRHGRGAGADDLPRLRVGGA